jgi:hypothetical protein
VTKRPPMVQPRRAVDEAEPEIADRPQRHAVIGEEAVQTIHHRGGEGAVETPPALIALKRRCRADVEPETERLDDRFSEGRDVAHADIEALAGKRVHCMRRIADQREAIGDEGPRHLKL